MRKVLLSLIALFFCVSLFAVPKAIVFDFGSVMTSPSLKKREAAAHFIQETFHFTPEEYENVNREMQLCIVQGSTHEDFWVSYAKSKGIELPADWTKSLHSVMWDFLGVNLQMYALVHRLKEQKIRVGMLSNTTDYRSKLIRSFGLYEPFEPCLLSCEMGIRKPDLEAYRLLLEKLELPANEVVFVDDKIANIEAANQLGIDGIFFDSEEQFKLELIKRGFLGIEGGLAISHLL